MQVSRLLSRLIDAQRPFVSGCPEPNRTFEASKVPSISLEAYVKRIEQYSGCTRATMVAALVFIDRILEKNPHFFLTERNVHRLLLSCVVAALKFYEDSFYSNKFYARIGGVSVLEMNALEIAQLNMINFDLYVSPARFAQYDDAVSATDVACNLDNTLPAQVEPVQYVGIPTNTTSTTKTTNNITNNNAFPITPSTADTAAPTTTYANCNQALCRGKRSNPTPLTDQMSSKAPRLSSSTRCPQQSFSGTGPTTAELLQYQPYQWITDQQEQALQEAAVHLHLLHKHTHQSVQLQDAH